MEDRKNANSANISTGEIVDANGELKLDMRQYLYLLNAHAFHRTRVFRPEGRTYMEPEVGVADKLIAMGYGEAVEREGSRGSFRTNTRNSGCSLSAANTASPPTRCGIARCSRKCTGTARIDWRCVTRRATPTTRQCTISRCSVLLPLQSRGTSSC